MWGTAYDEGVLAPPPPRQILNTLFMSLPSFANVTVILLLVYFIYAIGTNTLPCHPAVTWCWCDSAVDGLSAFNRCAGRLSSAPLPQSA